jgi:hypothetical protein
MYATYILILARSTTSTSFGNAHCRHQNHYIDIKTMDGPIPNAKMHALKKHKEVRGRMSPTASPHPSDDEESITEGASDEAQTQNMGAFTVEFSEQI